MTWGFDTAVCTAMMSLAKEDIMHWKKELRGGSRFKFVKIAVQVCKMFAIYFIDILLSRTFRRKKCTMTFTYDITLKKSNNLQ